MKTGHTRAAEGTYVAAADRDGRRLIGVVLGSPGPIYDPMVRLFDYGFSLAPGHVGLGVALPPPVGAAAPTTVASAPATPTTPATVATPSPSTAPPAPDPSPTATAPWR